MHLSSYITGWVWLTVLLMGIIYAPGLLYAQQPLPDSSFTNNRKLTKQKQRAKQLSRRELAKLRKQQAARLKKEWRRLKKQNTPTAELDSLRNMWQGLKKPQHLVQNSALYKRIDSLVDGRLTSLEKYGKALEELDSAHWKEYARQMATTVWQNDLQARQLRQELAPYIDTPFLQGVRITDLDSMNSEELQELQRKVFKNVEDYYVEKLLERQELIAFKQQQAELNALKNLPQVYRQQYEAYKNGEKLKQEARQQALSQASKLLADHAPQYKQAVDELSRLKRKYSYVPGTDKLSQAVKRNSLKGQPLKRRLVIGGNFQIVTAEPVVIDISPLVGYRFNKVFHIAAGASYRARFSAASSTYIRTNFNRDELTYGYRVFANHKLWRALFIHAEYERMSREFKKAGTDLYERQWQNGGLAGLGIRYSVTNGVQGQATLLYNFLHDNNKQMYPSPWVFRFGINLK